MRTEVHKLQQIKFKILFKSAQLFSVCKYFEGSLKKEIQTYFYCFSIAYAICFVG